MTATVPTTMGIELLDPRELVAHPRNVRADLGNLAGLTASIGAQGVIEPITVVPLAAGGHQVVAGHRRTAAAIAAGLELVPCVVRTDVAAGVDDNAGQAVHIGAMLAENLHREGLTAVEEARGVQAMLDLGVPISKVAKATGLDQKRVKKAIGVARLDEATAAAVVEQQLDLDSAAAIALYADEPETAARLVTAAQRGPGQLAHALEQEKQNRKAKAAFEARFADLCEAGRTVVESFAPDGARLTRLNAADGTWLADKEAEHLSCPGSAVHLTTTWDGLHETEVCTDWKANGHLDRWAGESAAKAKPETAEEKEAAKEERRRVIANNKAMQAANVVRREWLKAFLQQRTAPKELLRFTAESFAVPRLMDGWLSGLSAGGDSDAHKALGLEKPSYLADRSTTLTTGEQVSDGRLPLQLFAHVAAAHEVSISRESWRPNTVTGTANTARWLSFLASQGYTLSDVEQLVVDEASKPGGAS